VPPPVFQSAPKPVLIRAEPRSVRQAVVQPSRPAAVHNAVAFRPASVGKFVVQIGAFQNAANAQRAWNRVSSRVNLSNYTAINGFTKVSNASVTRVAIGGIGTHAAAVRLCARIQQTGGTCFVRSNAGDTPARWAQRQTVKVASR
jgi:cell division septation protein DedD